MLLLPLALLGTAGTAHGAYGAASGDALMLIQREVLALNRSASQQSALGWEGRPLCRKGEEAERDQERMSEQRDIQARQMEQWMQAVNQSQAIVYRRLEPLISAATQAASLLLTTLQRPIPDLLKKALRSAIKPGEPAQANPVDVDFNATLDRILMDLQNISDPILDMLIRSFFEIDRAQDRVLEESFPAVPRQFPFRGSSTIKNVSNATEVLELVTLKSLPALLLEGYPDLERAASLVANFPNHNSDIAEYVINSVVPFLIREVGPLLGDSPGKLPKRACITCQERYDTMTNSWHNPNSCMSRCLSVPLACNSGMTYDCVQAYKPCMSCYRQRLSDLDACRELDTNADAITRLDALIETLKPKSMKLEERDDFVDKLSKVILPWDES